MFEQLFGSKTRVKLLYLFYGNPNRSFYVREITRKIDEQINSVRRELANLLSIGLIKSETNNNRLYYEVNQEYEHFDPLTVIFGSGVSSSTAAEAALTEASEVPSSSSSDDQSMIKMIRSTGNVELVLLTGQFTRDERSGIDILIVGDINASKAAAVIADIEAAERKSIVYTIMTTKDYKYRLQVNDRFLSNVLLSKKQILINEAALDVGA